MNTNDDQVVEVIEQAITVEIWDQPSEARELAREALAALRAAGFDVYRPDECQGVTVEVMNVARGTGPIDGFYDAGDYRLVPVGVCDICGGTGWDGETIDGNSIDHGQPCACTVGGEGRQRVEWPK